MKAAIAVVFGLALAGLAQATLAQVPTPMPAGCMAPGAQSGQATPLPRIAAALKDKRKINILTIGASSAAARNAGRDYHDVIETYLEAAFKGLDVEIIDRGVSGELAQDAAERIKLEVALNEIDLVLWQVGTFDAMAHVPPEDFERTLTAAAQWLRSRNVDLVLVGLHYLRTLQGDEEYQAIRRAVQAVAAREGVLRIGRYEAGEALERARAAGKAPVNEFEMTGEGYACMAETVARALATGLFARNVPDPPAASRP